MLLVFLPASFKAVLGGHDVNPGNVLQQRRGLTFSAIKRTRCVARRSAKNLFSFLPVHLGAPSPKFRLEIFRHRGFQHGSKLMRASIANVTDISLNV